MYSALVQYKDDNYSAGTWYTMIVWLTRLDQSEPVAHPYRLGAETLLVASLAARRRDVGVVVQVSLESMMNRVNQLKKPTVHT